MDNVTQRNFKTSDDMFKFVNKEIAMRKAIEGPKAFVDSTVPLTLPVQKSEKGTKRKALTKAEDDDDIPTTSGYSRRLLLHGDKPRWYVITWNGDNTGTLRFLGYNNKGEELKGANKPKTFESNKAGENLCKRER